jgi:hypothetical protein
MRKQLFAFLMFGLLWVKVIAQTQITRVEYFFDNDPGFGNATAFAITPSADISDAHAFVSIAQLPAGIHQLYVRAQDNTGKWSIPNRYGFIALQVPFSFQNKAEYFLDTDPGFGLAHSISIPTAIELFDQQVSIPLNEVNEGFHQLFVRTRDNNGVWSMPNRFSFIKMASVGTLVKYVEYFIDTDPGPGKAVPVAIQSASNLADWAVAVNTAGLNSGKHRLYLRSRDEQGRWSITNQFEFELNNPVAGPAIRINSITRRPLCASETYMLSIDAVGSFQSGNQFRVELSDALGSFANPTVAGAVQTINDTLIACHLPRRLAEGNQYRLRVVSTNPTVAGIVSDSIWALRDRPDLGPDILAPIICLGETANLLPYFNTSGLTTHWNTTTPSSAVTGNYRLIGITPFGCADTALVSVAQDIAIWTGTVSNNWHLATNWNNGKVPTVTTHVIISNASLVNPIISLADAHAASVQLKQGSSIQLSNNRNLYISSNCSSLPSL